jgi:hypothetical protein
MRHLLGATAEICCATLRVVPITTADRRDTLTETQPTKVAGTLRRAVRSQLLQDSRWTAHGMCLLL